MIKRHQVSADHEIARHKNKSLDTVDTMLSLCDGETILGQPILDDNDQPLTLEALIQAIQNNGLRFLEYKGKLNDFVSKWVVTPAIDISTDLVNLELAKNAIEQMLGSATNISKLRNIRRQVTNPISYETFIYDKGYRFANIINDFLDASSFALRRIDFRNGNIVSTSDEEVREIVRRFLESIPNYSWYQFPPDVDDISTMEAIADTILSNIDGTDFTGLADLIDTNVDKLPLVRRNWAV